MGSSVVGVGMGGDLANARVWAGEPDARHGRFVPRFGRAEPRKSAPAHLRGLIAPLERKHGWTLDEQADLTALRASELDAGKAETEPLGSSACAWRRSGI